jgi:uncharacterized membrane protein YGL010W
MGDGLEYSHNNSDKEAGMRSQTEFLMEYGKSHRHPVNIWVHIVCVPVILISSLGLLWQIPVGSWLGLEGAAAYWINGGTIVAALSGIFYAILSLKTLVLMAGWFAVSVAIINGLEQAALPVGWISLAAWVAAWIVQVWGHKVEGKKPSFADDLVFLLIGPIFVSVEIAEKLGLMGKAHVQS